jgi:PTS system nitrogen regulatory IIA component
MLTNVTYRPQLKRLNYRENVQYFTNGVCVMSEMLTAKEMQTLLQVDRSTIYRMAEAGRLPAIKVGKQWRFPSEQVESWLGTRLPSPQTPSHVLPRSDSEIRSGELESLLPLECVQLIQETYADLLGVMLVVTDMEGNPITQVSNPCDLFMAISQVPDALQKCIRSWRKLATTINLEPQFSRSHLGLLCARGMIRVGTELKGMVVAGCVAPEEWPPSPAEVKVMADEFGVSEQLIAGHTRGVHNLDDTQKNQVLSFVQRIANIIAHIVDERNLLMGKLETISSLAKL